MGDTLLDQIETIERKLAELKAVIYRQEQQAKETAKDVATPMPRVQDSPTTNAPAHEIQPQLRPTQAQSWGDPLADVLGFPKDGR